MALFNAILSFICWGLFPIYWALLREVRPEFIIANRFIWSFVFFLGIVIAQKKLKHFQKALSQRRLMITASASSLLLLTNWLLYVWGVNNGHALETSLGYFISPLVNVVLGVLFFHERLNSRQWISVALAALGVSIIGWGVGQLPWIALVLAFTWGFYATVRKVIKAEQVVTSTLETLTLLVPAVLLLILQWDTSVKSLELPAFTAPNFSQILLLVGTGVVTGLPLWLYTISAPLLELSTLGIFQFISPTMQFLCAILYFHEPLNQKQLLGFLFIWIGLGIYTSVLFKKSKTAKAS